MSIKVSIALITTIGLALSLFFVLVASPVYLYNVYKLTFKGTRHRIDFHDNAKLGTAILIASISSLFLILIIYYLTK